MVLQAAVQQSQGYFQVLVGAPLPTPPAAGGKSLVSFLSSAFGSGAAPADAGNAVGEVCFSLPESVAAAIPEGGAPVTVTIAVSKEEGLSVQVSAEDVVLSSLKVPSA